MSLNITPHECYSLIINTQSIYTYADLCDWADAVRDLLRCDIKASKQRFENPQFPKHCAEIDS